MESTTPLNISFFYGLMSRVETQTTEGNPGKGELKRNMNFAGDSVKQNILEGVGL